jgi:hypothetical protein
MAARSLARVVWGESGGAEVDSGEALDTLLDALHAQAATEPFIADVVLASGESLSIGLGSDWTVLTWVSATGEPPYFGSRGDTSATGVVVFRYSGSWSEFPSASAIPVESGRRAVREFLALGHRPETVAWAEV